MQHQEHEVEPIRFVILGMPYTIRPTENLTVQDINDLVKSIKELVEFYSHKGYDERRIPLLIAFHIADENRQLQESYQLPLQRLVEKLQAVIEEDT